MAVTVDYNNTDFEDGVYGAYNDFVALINTNTSTPSNLTYKVTVTALNNGSVTVRSVTPIGTIAIVEPLKLVQDSFFKSEYNGSTEHSQPFSYSNITISIQEFSSSSAAVPPTSSGAAVSNTFYVYNGYEEQPLVLNYREPNWYDTTPIKLPKVKKTLNLLNSDIELLSFPSEIKISTGAGRGGIVHYAHDLITESFNASGTSLGVATIDLTLRPSLTGIAYWNININNFFTGAMAYTESKVRYDDGEGATVDTEIITIKRTLCNPKDERYRLYWVNRYGGAEYQNFSLSANTSYKLRKGKRIQSDGIDYAATSFANIQSINNPNIQEFGNSVTKEITIRSDYFTNQSEIDSLSEVLKSPVLILFDSNNVAYPVVLKTSNYNNDLLKEGLVKLEMTLQYANNELKQIK